MKHYSEVYEAVSYNREVEGQDSPLHPVTEIELCESESLCPEDITSEISEDEEGDEEMDVDSYSDEGLSDSEFEDEEENQSTCGSDNGRMNDFDSDSGIVDDLAETVNPIRFIAVSSGCFSDCDD